MGVTDWVRPAIIDHGELDCVDFSQVVMGIRAKAAVAAHDAQYGHGVRKSKYGEEQACDTQPGDRLVDSLTPNIREFGPSIADKMAV